VGTAGPQDSSGADKTLIMVRIRAHYVQLCANMCTHRRALCLHGGRPADNTPRTHTYRHV
jgi:hypothetical protein